MPDAPRRRVADDGAEGVAPMDLRREVGLTDHEHVAQLGGALEHDHDLGVQRLKRGWGRKANSSAYWPRQSVMDR